LTKISAHVELGPRIASLIEELRPPAVLCLGLWPGEPLLRLERVAVNIADFEIPDNAGFITRGPVVEDGAEAYRSTLPLDRMRERLLAAGIPARLSSTAGNFLCNALMYHALRRCAEHTPPRPCGFIHLPYLPAQVAAARRASSCTSAAISPRWPWKCRSRGSGWRSRPSSRRPWPDGRADPGAPPHPQAVRRDSPGGRILRPVGEAVQLARPSRCAAGAKQKPADSGQEQSVEP
jgi:pyrrolidone-carboxylate peptidase